MANAQLKLADELLYIYTTLRKLKWIRRAEPKKEGGAESNINLELFPKRFFLKLVNQRIAELDKFANETCDNTLHKICDSFEKRSEEASSPRESNFNRLRYKQDTKYQELDEYFHISLYYLYDFISDLDWHEADVEILDKVDSEYVAQKLYYFDQFLNFRRTLIGSAVSRKSDKSVKMSKRRVRFQDAEPNDEYDRQRDDITEQDIRNNQSILAFDLLLYAISLFSQKLSVKLFAWSTPIVSNLTSSIGLLKEFKQESRTNRLQSIAQDTETFINVHLVVLNFSHELKTNYILKHLSGTLLIGSAEHLLETKRRRASIGLQKINENIETIILFNLAKNSMQIFLDLIIDETNLSPTNLSSEKIKRSREEIVKSEETTINLVTNWLKLIGDRLNHANQLQFFFDTLANGFNKSAEIVSAELKNTKDSTHEVDSIVSKIRYIKFNYMMTSLNETISKYTSRGRDPFL